MGVEVTVERLFEPVDLGPHPRTRQLCQHLGVTFPGDQRGHHRPPGDPEVVGGHHRQFDAGVFEEFFDPVLLRGTHPDQVGLGPARQMFDVAGVDQPRIQPMRLEQVEHRFPVIRSGFHHPLDPQLHQPVASPISEPVIVECVGTSCSRLPSPSRAGTRTQHTTSALPMSRAATLAMICSSSRDSCNTSATSCHRHNPVLDGVVAGGIATGTTESNPRARTSGNNEGPATRSQRPARRRPRRTIGAQRHKATTAPFSSRNGRPTRVILARRQLTAQPRSRSPRHRLRVSLYTVESWEPPRE